jgi:hypothetical protein
MVRVVFRAHKNCEVTVDMLAWENAFGSTNWLSTVTEDGSTTIEVGPENSMNPVEFRVLADAVVGYPTLTCISDEDVETFYESSKKTRTNSRIRFPIADVLCLPHGSIAALRHANIMQLAYNDCSDESS